MARPDVAVQFDKTQADLSTGICVCIFHGGCTNSLQADGRFFCPRCYASAPSTVAITKRQCLRCPCYSVDVLCGLCWDLCLDHITKLTREQDIVVLHYAASDCLEKWGFCIEKQDVHLQWIARKIIDLRRRPFYLFETDGQLCTTTYVKLLRGIWKKTASAYGSFQLDAWMELVHPRLQVVVGYSDRCLQECFDAISRYDPAIVHVNGMIEGRAKTDELHAHSTAPARGQDLLARGLSSSYDRLVQSGCMFLLFLPQDNDTYYHPRPKVAHPREPDFYKQWVFHLKL